MKPTYEELEKKIIELETRMAGAKRAGVPVYECEERFRAIAENFPDMIELCDELGRIIFANPTTEKLTGYSADEIINLHIAEIIHPDERRAFAFDWERILEGSDVPARDMRLIKKGGDLLAVNIKSFVVYSANHEKYIGSIIRDISDTKRIENELTEHQKSLQQEIATQTKHLEELLVFSKNLVSKTDLNSLYRQVTSVAKDLLGFDFSTLMILTEDKKYLVIRDTLGFPESMIGTFALLEGQGLSTYVVNEKTHAMVEDFRSEKRFTVPPVVFEKNITSSLSVPMMIGEEVFGVLIGHTHERRIFPKDEIDLYQSFANQAAVAIKNAMHTEALYYSEQKFRTIVNTLPSPLFFKNAEGRYLECNDAFAEYIGLPKEKIINSTVFDVAPGELAQVYHKADLDLMEKRGKQIYETKVRYADGNYHDVIFHKATWTDTKDEVQGLVGIIVDITERKNAENELAAEKERLAVTLRSIGDGVITTDTSGNITLLNKVAEQLTGWRQEEAAGQPLDVVFNIINERTGAQCENPVVKVLNTGKIVGLANHTALIAKDGTMRSIADSGAPIRDRDSRIIGVVLVFRDVTEQYKTEQELQRVKKIESVGLLAGGIAHDFNNILAAILGNLSLGLMDSNLQSETRRRLIEAEKATIRAKDLTQQLLTFSRGGEPIKETASLKEVIQECSEFVLHGDKVACSYNIPDNLWLVDFDKGQISQVVQNIVINASHAMPNGGTIDITCDNVEPSNEHDVFLLPGQPYVKIVIRDHGIGIQPDILDKIFDPYFSTKSGGSGLGLAICHSIISKHDGHITVQSQLGKGTTFTIYLPASSKAGPIEIGRETDVAEAFRAKVLIMDDEEMVRNVSKEMITHLGHEVVLAEDGISAIQLFSESLAEQDPIDLIIMDLTIPGGMGGKDAAREILKLDPHAKLIVASGYSNDPVMANYAQYGFCAAIAKPYEINELRKLIQRCLVNCCDSGVV